MFKHRAFWLIVGVITIIGLTRWDGDLPSSPQAYAEKRGSSLFVSIMGTLFTGSPNNTGPMWTP